MSKEILIQTQKGERQVAIIENGRVDDFHIEVDRYQSLLGNIYKGRVESILPSINAAFVNIGQERNGFLYLTDAVEPPPVIDGEENQPQGILGRIFRGKQKNPEGQRPPHPPKKDRNEIPFKVGQEILVQVVKDPFGEKGARLTTHISLPGRFVVYMPFDKQMGVSKKIENTEERQRLREIIKGFTFVRTGGFIIRTASLKQQKHDLIRDAKFLYKIWTKIHKKAEEEKAPALIYEEGDLTWVIVRDYLTEKIDSVIIDNESDLQRIRRIVQTLIGRSMVNRIQLYTGKQLLFEAKNVDKELLTIYDTHVHVKSGAYIVIEQTEGLTVVDVNSGRFKVKASPGDAAFMVNMEVIPEIARQLRLRDLGGIIVIDFIDMTREEHKRRLLEALNRALTKDPAKTEVFKISPLGLVEMTRARTGKTIESISFGECPYCDGRGRVRLV
ncbi:MAG TPA: Rne/Rng family ribonuclease [Candidatus Omnitrophota bacterium]|nr:Rne/Rng family ribonuclease [Candidatus Omnitrophota bacterium]